MVRSRLKKSILFTHRWVGLSVGLYFVAVGLSGSYLVYPETFEAWMKPGLYRTKGERFVGEKIDLAAIVGISRAGVQAPLSVNPDRIIDRGGSRDSVRVMWSLPRPGERRRFISSYVDPNTRAFLGSENARETVRGILFSFHHDLFSGSTGRTVVAYGGIGVLGILLSGLYLAWPKRGKWAARLKVPRVTGVRRWNRAWHEWSGVYSLALMVVVTFSGIFLARADWFKVSGSVPPMKSAEEKSTKDVEGAGRFAELYAAAPSGAFEIRIDPKKGRAGITQGERVTEFNLATGEISPALPNEAKGFFTRALQHALHSGDFWGRCGRVLVFGSGLLPLFFYVTGIILWISRKPFRFF